MNLISNPEALDVPSFAESRVINAIDDDGATGATSVDPSGAVRETQERLDVLCAEQGHLVASVIDHNMGEARHVCHRCGNTEIRTLSIIK